MLDYFDLSLLLDRVAPLAQDAACCYSCSVVCLRVRLLVATVSATKADKPIEMSFRTKAPCIWWGPDLPQAKMTSLGGISRSVTASTRPFAINSLL